MSSSFTRMGLPWLRIVLALFSLRDAAAGTPAGTTAQLTLNGRTLRFDVMDPGARLVRTGKRLMHRNGEVDLVYSQWNGAGAKACLSAGKSNAD